MDKHFATLPVRLSFLGALAILAVLIVFAFHMTAASGFAFFAVIVLPYAVAMLMNNHWAVQGGLGTFIAVIVGAGFAAAAASQPSADLRKAAEMTGILHGFMAWTSWMCEMGIEFLAAYMHERSVKTAQNAAVEQYKAEHVGDTQPTIVQGFKAEDVEFAMLYGLLKATGGDKSPLAAKYIAQGAKFADWEKWMLENLPEQVKFAASVQIPQAASAPAAAATVAAPQKTAGEVTVADTETPFAKKIRMILDKFHPELARHVFNMVVKPEKEVANWAPKKALRDLLSEFYIPGSTKPADIPATEPSLPAASNGAASSKAVIPMAVATQPGS